MPEQSEFDQNDIGSIDEPRVLESNSAYGDGHITFQTRPDGDFDATKTGSGDLDREVVFIDFEKGHKLLPILREAIPALSELYPQPPHSSDEREQRLILPGQKRTATFREKWLRSLGANTAPISYTIGDELNKEKIVEQTAGGNLIIVQGDQSADFALHDRINHIFGVSAIPQETLDAFFYVAQKVPDLAKINPDAADTVQKAIALALDSSTTIQETYGGGASLPSLDILDQLVFYTGANSNQYHDRTGSVPNDFVHSALRDRGFEVVSSLNRLGSTKKQLPSGKTVSFVGHIYQGERPELVVPREQELLVDYIPGLVAGLTQAA